jgi:hypothetical protein
VELEHLVAQLGGQDPAGEKPPLVRYRERIAAAIDSLYRW